MTAAKAQTPPRATITKKPLLSRITVANAQRSSRATTTKKPFLSKASAAKKFLLLLLPAVLYLSAFPALTLGADPTMNLELSLPIIWLVLFSLTSALSFADRSHFFANLLDFRLCFKKPILLVSILFPAYASLSVIWSSNHLRAVLTAGLLWLLWFSILNIVVILTHSASAYKRKLLKTFQISTFFACLFCWLQCLANIFFDQNLLLCAGCTYESFGFPHPNGFTLEPQFMGNLLLAPALLSLFYIKFPRRKNPSQKNATIKKNPSRKDAITNNSPSVTTRKTSLNLFLSIFVIATLFLTFSRGAIFSFLLGALVVFALNFRTTFNNGSPYSAPLVATSVSNSHQQPPRLVRAQSALRSSLLQFLAIIISFIIALFAQGLFATFSPTSDTFISGVTKAIHHLSLGHLDFRPNYTTSSSTPQPQAASNLPQALSKKPQAKSSLPQTESNLPQALSEKPQAQFSGYIAESTDIRNRLNSLALDRWNDDAKTILFGTGLGSAGTELAKSLGSPKEIVQNEYISLLLELGLVAYAILAFVIFIAIKLKRFEKRTIITLTPLLIAYAFSLLFFSGLPNALHIYLLSPLLAGLFRTPI